MNLDCIYTGDLKCTFFGTFLMVQWIRLAMQDTQVRSLVGQLRFHTLQSNKACVQQLTPNKAKKKKKKEEKSKFPKEEYRKPVYSFITWFATLAGYQKHYPGFAGASKACCCLHAMQFLQVILFFSSIMLLF